MPSNSDKAFAASQRAPARYVVVHDFMMRELGLSGVPLLLFARIYGFCTDGSKEFYESKNGTAKFLNIAPRSVFRAMEKLLDLEYVVEVGTRDTQWSTASKVYQVNWELIESLRDGGQGARLDAMHDGISGRVPDDVSPGCMTRSHLIRKIDNKDFE